MRRTRWLLLLVVGLLGGACGPAEAPASDAGTAAMDAGRSDAEVLDSGAVDAVTSDGDASASDSGSDAAAPMDGGLPETDAAALDLESALDAAGFAVAPSTFEVYDLSDCCSAASCSGNNPTSPYLTVYVPRGAGQTAPNEAERADGTSNQFRLRADEAIVLVGTAPPRAAYFGLTPYLMSRDDGTGMRSPIFASLTDTLNNAVLPVDSATSGDPFGQRFAIVLTSDRTTDTQVRAALAAAGVSARGTSTLPLDASVVRFGLDAAADTLGVLFRVALFEDSALGDAWLAAPTVTALRVTPRAPIALDPLPPPVGRPRDAIRNEAALGPAVDRLEAAVRAANAGHVIRDLMVSDGAVDPAACISAPRFCAGDNRDTVYPATGLFRLGARDSLYVLGVDHEASSKATYASASVYAIDHLVGLRAVTSREWAGSASAWLPGDPDAEQLFVWRIARDCGTDARCLEIPEGSCPDGAPLTAFLAVAFRAYLEPTSSTGPDPTTLVRERVLLVNGL